MLQPQLINMPPRLSPAHTPHRMARSAAKEAPDTLCQDVLTQTGETMPESVNQTPQEEKTAPPPVNGQEEEQPESNLLVFPVIPPPVPPVQPPVEQQPDPDARVKTPAPGIAQITQAIVSILERYPNNAPPDMEIVPLLQDYLQQLVQLEQPLPPEVQELQTLLEEVLARTPQTENIGKTPQKQDKLAQIIDLLRGYLYPLENVNDAAPEQKSAATAAEIIPVRPPEAPAGSADTLRGDGGKDGQKEAKRPLAETPAHHIGARIDIQPHKVLFAERLTAQATPQFTPLTAENLFETMIERIVALPDAEPHMEIALKPDHLGKLSIDLQLGQNGLTAKIIASDENVRNMLAANLSRLSESLAEKGIRVENVEIVYSQLSDKPFDQRQPQREQENGKHNRFGSAALWGAPETAPVWWDTAYDASAYPDEWGMGLSSVEYRA